MANISKSFNFKGGFQVDEDVLIVRGANVGIGSQVPTESLDVAGNIRAEGLILTGSSLNLGDFQFGDVTGNSILVGDNLEITGTTIAPKAGGSQIFFIGDGSGLSNIPTSQWIDIDVGLGFTSIYSAGNVGVDTNDPRYVFQVGGVPFPKSGLNVNQLGVGIEDGNIDIGGNIRFRGSITGDGSNLSNIDASNIGLGTIPNASLPTDPTFNTVTATTFVGTATSALNLDPTADAVANSLTATTITGTNIFSDQIQVGNTDNLPYTGDIDLVKSGKTTLYSLSTDDVSRVFVGSQREVGGNRRYGGLRYGLSDAVDMDVVNYDIGNLRFVLHDGSGGTGATRGGFQWLYGQTDRVLATLDKSGKLSLDGNSLPTDDTLLVGGNATITGNATIENDATVDGDLTVGGNINITGSIGVSDQSFTNLDVSNKIDVGNGSGSGGATIDSFGNIQGTSIQVYSGGSVVSTITGGNANFNTTVTASNVTATSALAGDTLDVQTSISGPDGLTISSTGLSVNSISAVDLDVTTITSSSLNINGLDVNGTATVDQLDSSGSVNGASGNFTSLNSTELSTIDELVSGDISTLLLESTNSTLGIATAISLDVTGNTTANSVNANSVTVSGDLRANNIVSSTGGNITFADPATITTLTAQNIEVTNSRIKFGANTLEVALGGGGTNLVFTVFDTGGVELGTVTLPFD